VSSDDRAVEPTQILAALASLRPIDQELLRMVAWDGMTRTEMASVLGIRENAVDQRLFRARTRLRHKLSPSMQIIDSEEAAT
jgi:RNA polymerase sigma-70 factor (ECF subfamily)